MVDISSKQVSYREAIAKGVVRMKPSTIRLIQKGEIAKGDVLTLAQIAGILGAKQTPALIPLCHPIAIEDIQVNIQLNEANNLVEITAIVRGEGKTGFEMEALTAAAISALTVYDMCKSIDPFMNIEIGLLRKSGGKSGEVKREP
jgi:cyclic pyranopterin phosphate synthase